MQYMTRQGDTDVNGVISYVTDTREEVKTLPVDVRPGSTCLVIEDSSVWMLNGKNEWKEI